jgi:hypothetical protein
MKPREAQAWDGFSSKPSKGLPGSQGASAYRSQLKSIASTPAPSIRV